MPIREHMSDSHLTWNRLRAHHDEEHAWELFHENSKTSPYEGMPPNEVIVAKMARLWESLPFPQYPAFPLPSPASAPTMPLAEAIVQRRSAGTLSPQPIRLETLASLLHFAYGVTSDKEDGTALRALRAAPSGGALFPLELYFHATNVTGLKAGIYHYDPTRNEVQLLREGNEIHAVADAMVQQDIATGSSLIIWITAIFERTVFKYGDRGYRFVLIEAGHVGQNLNLVATALGLECLNIGGFFDRRMDELLGLDGLTHSTIYMAAIGAPAGAGGP